MDALKNVQTPIVKIIDSTYEATADGEFNGFADFQKYVDDLFTIQPAVESFKEFRKKNGEATPSEREAVKEALRGQMPNVPDRDKYLINEILSGVTSTFALGYKRGKEDLLARLEQTGMLTQAQLQEL